jgi:hypothetical protein
MDFCFWTRVVESLDFDLGMWTSSLYNDRLIPNAESD